MQDLDSDLGFAKDRCGDLEPTLWKDAMIHHFHLGESLESPWDVARRA